MRRIVRYSISVVIVLACAVLIYAQLTMVAPASSANCKAIANPMARAACTGQREGKP